LNQAFGTTDPEPRIYGGIEPSLNVKKFMKLPANLRRFPKMELLKEEVRAEETATKQRWSIREMENEGDDVLTIEQRKKRKDKEKVDRQVCDGNKIDFSNVRATDLPHNKVIYMPKPCSLRDEIKIENQRMEVIEEIKKYIADKCDDEGNIRGAEVLDEDELAGLEEIEEGIRNKGWMLYYSDKSGRLVLDTKDNFLDCMADHYSGDKVVDIDEAMEAEDELNNLSRVFAGVLKLGVNANQGQRCRETLISTMAAIPAMQGYRKDHKGDINGDKSKGPPLRPLCAANKSMNAPLGCLVSNILKSVGDEQSAKNRTEIMSTEELCREAEDVNRAIADETTDRIDVEHEDNVRRQQPRRTCNVNKVQNEHIVVKPKIQNLKKRIIGSMDAKALYPSIVKKLASSSAKKAIQETEMMIENVNITMLTRLVAMKTTVEEIEEEGLADVVPRPKARTTFRSFANPKGNSKRSEGSNQFEAAAREPTGEQVKKLLGMAVGTAIEECMDRHFYKIGGKIYRQRKGGSIGSSLTGETARVFMLEWDKLFLKKVDEMGIKLDLYKRYVDDIVIVLNTIANGWWFSEESKAMAYDKDRVDLDSDELRTFKILQAIANTIHEEIQMTVDVPGEHRNQKLPVLDLNMWIETDAEGRQRICHTFYKKDVSSPFTILQRSAMSMNTKRTAHFQEAIRRLRNCDKSQPWIQRAVHMSEWVNMLRASGYNERYRLNILQGAIARYEQMRKDEMEGTIQNLYRNRSQIVQMCKDKGGKATAATWFMSNGVTGTMNTAPTPDSCLRDMLQKSLMSVPSMGGGRTKVIETGGTPVSLGLTKNDPFRVSGCDYGDPTCIVDPKVSCSAMSVCYQVTCSCGESVTNVTRDTETNTNTTDSRTVTTVGATGEASTFTIGTPRGNQVGVTAGMRRSCRDNNTNMKKKMMKRKKKMTDTKMNYLGITGRTMHARQKEHVKAVNACDMKNAIAKHASEFHKDNPPEFVMKLISKHRTNLEKAVNEGLLIEKQDKKYLMNKRSEWGKTRGVVRLTAARG
jgi:hypothetical protein